ncbi:MAG: hypothetical protein HC884_18695 [Chloroflexaceae bacterium]|nr:hypothetical protein [Chloroflexaceae bacterium]
MQQSIEDVGLPVQRTAAIPAILEHLRGTWTKDIADKPVFQQAFARLLNTYLRRVHGYGPLTAQKERQHAHAHLTGYTRDPAWQFPALRRLLPAQPGIVGEDGAVECEELHFEDSLLAYWKGQPVMVRRSLHSDAAAYIYANDEMLCLAMARELRRSDGSYRTRLPGGKP